MPYPQRFPFKAALVDAATKNGVPIEEVKISIIGGGKTRIVRKLYGDLYEFDGGEISLTKCDIHVSPTGRWWAWVGKKAESGAYTDARVRGLRIRVRNIQIDGADIFRDVFREAAKSHIRFQDYYLGEVFIKPTALIPNARRDGFEEDAAWRGVRTELGTVARALGSEAYLISNAGQLSLPAQRKAMTKSKDDFRKLKKAKFADVDKTVSLVRAISTRQNRIAKASEMANPSTLAALTAIGADYADMKLEAMRHVGAAALEADREKIESEVKTALVAEIMEVLTEGLSPHLWIGVE